MPEWYAAPQDSPISKIRCFIADFQEPYVMVRYTKNTPLFHEKFINYGFNKVQYVEHLRAAGFSFFILNHAFAMDLPHPDSSFRSQYVSNLEGEVRDMQRVYSKFQVWLNVNYANISSFKICPTKRYSYYTYVVQVN